MIRVRTHASIAEIGRERWDALFPNALEGYDYLHAVEKAGLAGFRFFYVVVERRGRPVCAAPGFFTDYALDTTLTGAARDLVAGVRKLAPRLLTLKLACLGSPCTETALIGFDTARGPSGRGLLASALMDGFEEAARAESCGLLAIKDAPVVEGSPWATVLQPMGYRPVAGLPVAWLNIDFPDIETYLARLSAGTRKDMRRKLKVGSQVRVELRHDLAGVLDPVLALYRQTRARAEMQFEELTPNYFTGILRQMGDRALCALYFADDQLLAANLLLRDQETLLDKFFCMDAERGRAFNLYFLSWFTNLSYCLNHGLKRYQSGQAAYRNKLRLGSGLTRTQMYFRHRNPVLNAALRAAAPLLAADPEPEVAG
jgi:predicted N-acyltransferase